MFQKKQDGAIKVVLQPLTAPTPAATRSCAAKIANTPGASKKGGKKRTGGRAGRPCASSSRTAERYTRSRSSCAPDSRAQCAQQYRVPSASTPWPMILQRQ
jgi:hypothetical protein